MALIKVVIVESDCRVICVMINILNITTVKIQFISLSEGESGNALRKKRPDESLLFKSGLLFFTLDLVLLGDILPPPPSPPNLDVN